MKWKPSLDFWIAFALFWITLIPIVLSADDIGLTYDEPIYGGAALKIARWMQDSRDHVLDGDISFPIRRTTVEQYWGAKDMQPPFAKCVTAVSLLTLTPLIGYLAAVRFASGFLLGICVAALYLWGTQIHSRKAGLVGALSLLLMPCLWGHAHLTTMDIPVAVMVFLTSFFVWQLAQSPSIGWTALAGLAAGCAVGTKMNGLLPYPVLLIWALSRGRRAFLHTAVALLLVAPVVFFLTWPWMWFDTLIHLRQYLAFQLKHYAIGVSYFGKVYVIPPWHYPAVMTAITTPALTLLLAVVGIIYCFALPLEKRHPHHLLLGCFLVQLIAFSMPGVPKYNGTRLFLSIFPFLAMFAGVGFETLSEFVRARLATSRFAAGAGERQNSMLVFLVGALCLVPGLNAIISIHPFELSYYNQLVGGLPGAVKRGFEPTYWGDTYFQTLGFFNEKASAGSTINVSPPGVISYFEMYQRSGALREDLHFSAGDQQLGDADYVVFHTRIGEMSPVVKALFKKGRPVYTIACQDVALNVVYPHSEVQRVMEKVTPH